MKIQGFIKHTKTIHSLPVFLRILKGCFKRGVLSQPVLRSVELAVTFACPAKCEFCYAAEYHTKSTDYLTVDEIKEFWTNCQKLGAIHVNITGGEPLVREDICDIVRALSPHNTIVSMVTNAYLLDENLVMRLKEAGLKAIQISLDSFNPYEHDAIKGLKNSYVRVLEAVYWFKKAELPFICLSAAVEHGGIEKFKRILKLAEMLDVFLLINLAVDVGRWKNNVNIKLTKEDFQEIDMLKRHPLVREENIYNFSLRDECPIGIEKIYVDAYGNVYPCDRFPEPWGNIRETSIVEIWERMVKDPRWKKNMRCYIYESCHARETSSGQTSSHCVDT